MSGLRRFFPEALCLIVAWSGCGDDQQPAGRFPPGFLWGVSVAGFQVDMGCPTLSASQCVDPRSDWYVWVTTPELIDDPGTFLSGDPVENGPGHWELYETDFQLAARELNLGAFRTSIEWSRVFPVSTMGVESHEDLMAIADPDALAHYRAMFTAMRAEGLSPLVTLNHYTLPTWIHDAVGCHNDLDDCSPRGWLDHEDTVREIAKYAGFVAAELGDLIDHWATENEPFAVVLAGYLQPGADRTNPPGVSLRFDEVKAVAMAMIEAHARMYDAVKAADTVDADNDGSTSEVGLVFAVAPARPADPERELDLIAAENLFYLYNLAFLDAVIDGLVDDDLDGQQDYRDDLDNRMDYLGVNYYAVTVVAGPPYPGASLPDLSPLTTFDPLSLEIRYDTPAGIYQALLAMAERYPDLPLYVTENGTPDVDDAEYPTKFIVEHLTWVSRAIRDGADVRGYFYWSMMDNYEWNHGMGLRFGLYAVDPSDPQKCRVARPAAEAYARIAAANRIPDDLLQAYPIPD